MARENQGLQIALIIFVMLTIILGVTTFLFFRQAEEGNDKFLKLTSDMKATNEAKNKLDNECKKYKTLMGFPADLDEDAIKNDFVKQMTPFETLCPKKQDGTRDGIEFEVGDGQKKYLPSYKAVEEHQAKLVADRQTELASTQTSENKFKQDYKTRVESMKPEIDKLTVARDSANKLASTYKSDFDKEYERFKGDQALFAGDLQKASKEGEEKLKAKEDELKERDVLLESINTEKKKLTEKLATVSEKKKPVQENEFPGYITWVDERRGVVWINLGRADGLQPLTSFSVYPEKPTVVSKESAKASIEVTAIRGEHEAEARILPGETSKLADPIMPRDKIYSPVWSRGTKKHFALAGFMDIDGDGRSDLPIVRSLVTMNRGVVDMDIDDKGEQQGAISSDTDYLVLGTPPDGKTATKEALDNFSRAVGAAKSNNVKQIKLDEFLQLMGWKPPTSVRRFGAGARPSDTAIKPSDSPAKLPGGGARDDRFKPRTPPQPGAAGAY